MIPDYATLPELEIFTQLQAFDEGEQRRKRRYSEIGLAALAAERLELWKRHIDSETGYPCRSFSRWVLMACPAASSTVHAAKKDMEAFVGPRWPKEDGAGVPAGDLAEIPHENIWTMKQLSSKVRRQPAVLAAAKQDRAALVKLIQADYKDQHIEAEGSFRFTPSESASKIIAEVLGMAMQRGAEGKNDALELIAVTAKHAWERESLLELEAENRQRVM